MRGPFKRLFGRSAPAAYVESRLERLASYPPMPPPPPGPEPIHQLTPSGPPVQAAPSVPTGPQVKLILADGSESPLPEDPELAARADYLMKSMLPPRPPAPDPKAP